MTKLLSVPKNFIFCVLCAIILTTSAPAQLLTLSHPQQNIQSVNVGANVVFTVEATSQSGAVEYHWQYSKGGATFANLQDADFNGRVSGSQTATLHIDNAQNDDSARFRCLVKDPATGTGTKPTNSGPAFLTVSTSQPFQITSPTGPPGPIDRGKSAAFEVEITGQSGTLGGVWEFRSDAVGGSFLPLQDGLQNSQSTISGSTLTVLHIDNAQPSDTGKYRYIVNDKVGTSTFGYNSGAAHLTVNPVLIPGFTISPPTPPSGSVTPGGSVTTTITVNPVNGFSGTVNLTASGVPSGITASFMPSSLTLPSSNTSTLTLAATSTPKIGPATITIAGTDAPGNLQDSTTFSLTVNSGSGGGNAPSITRQPADTTMNARHQDQGDIVESAVFKVEATGALNYQWQFRPQGSTGQFVNVPESTSALCANPDLSGAIICGSTTPTLRIFNPQNQNEYLCQVSNNAGTTPSSSAQLTLMAGTLPEANPEPELQDLHSLIQPPGKLTGTEDWQWQITWDPVNRPWGNGENKSVIGAAIGLFYGPKITFHNRWTPAGPVIVDYRCWWQSFLDQQNGEGVDNIASRYFQGTEFGSFDYTGWVDTAVAGVAYWTYTPQAAFELQNDPPNCSFDPGRLRTSAQKYLRSAVGIYALVAGIGPQAEFVGVTGPTYIQQTRNGPTPVPNVLIPNTNPSQYMSSQFSVDRAANALQSPAIALAGQRTAPGFWSNDLRAPILCLAVGFSCDTRVEQIGQYSLLEGGPQQHGQGPLATILTGLLDINQKMSLQAFISDQSTDATEIQSLTSSVKVAQRIDFLGWKGVRTSCMDDNNSNNYRGIATGIVYWQNGHFMSKGPELDFLYWFNNHGITDGFQNCSFKTSVDPSNGKTRYELDALNLDNTIGATIYLPSQDQRAFYFVLDNHTAGLHSPPASAAAVTASPAGGVYSAGQSVTLSSATPGATIYYTTDSSLPTSSSTVYTAPITFNTSATIDAVASAPGFDDSTRLSSTYILKAASPAFSPAGGTYTANQSVTLSDASPGAAIYYTTDGSTPTASSPAYGGPIAVSTGQTIKAIAVAPGLHNSDIGSAAYVIHQPPPTITSINATTGSTGGGTVITITGTNFVAGASVTFAGTAATGVNVVNSTQITATTPTHSAGGTVTVVVANPDGQTGTLANSFNYFIPMINISWVRPSGASFGPPNTLTVDGSALNGSSPVQTVWRDVTVNGSWNQIAAQSTPDGGGSWANTIPSSNYCHSFAVYANYLNVSSPTINYVGVGSPYCSETAYVNWIEPPSQAGFGPAGSLVVQGNATGASSAAAVMFYWSDVTAGTGWNQASPSTPDASGTWYNYIPNVTYWHQYNVYVIYDAFDTRNGQGVCTYSANGGTTWCPR